MRREALVTNLLAALILTTLFAQTFFIFWRPTVSTKQKPVPQPGPPGTAYVEFRTDVAKATHNATSTRYALDNVHMLPEGDSEGLLIATDGKQLIVAEARVDGDKAGLIPAAVLPTRVADWSPKGRKAVAAVFDGTHWSTPADETPVEIAEGRFPSVAEILKEPPTKFVEVSLDAESLLQAAQALNKPGENPVVHLVIDVSDPLAPVIVISNHGAGVIMPCSGDYGQLDTMIGSYKFIRDRLIAAERKHGIGPGRHASYVDPVKQAARDAELAAHKQTSRIR